MSARSHARALSGVAAGLTAMALLAATMTVPASAAPVPFPVPVPSSTKLKLPDGNAASRVIKDRYLVETVATPLSRGGTRFASKASTDAARSAAKFAGAKVGSAYSELWSGVEVTATSEQVQELAQSPSVKAVYPVLRVDLPKTTKSAITVSSKPSDWMTWYWDRMNSWDGIMSIDRKTAKIARLKGNSSRANANPAAAERKT